jgi:hypothetical protein
MNRYRSPCGFVGATDLRGANRLRTRYTGIGRRALYVPPRSSTRSPGRAAAGLAPKSPVSADAEAATQAAMKATGAMIQTREGTRTHYGGDSAAGPGLVGKKPERVHVCRAERGEVPVIERRDLLFGETLDERDDARVDDAQGEVAIRVLELAAADQIEAGRRFDAVGALEDVVEEGEPDLARQPLMTPVIELGQDQSRNDEILGGRKEQGGAPVVIRVRLVERREQRPGIEN